MGSVIVSYRHMPRTQITACWLQREHQNHQLIVRSRLCLVIKKKEKKTVTCVAKNITYIPSIDLESPQAGSDLINFLQTRSISHLDVVIITAGYFATETLKEPSFVAQERMYRTCAIGPTILVTSLANKDDKLLNSQSKVIFVSSESGSIALRHDKEGGGNYGHHASKAALNMVAKLLSLDLKERGVAVAAVHPGFMRTEMTRRVGFDKFWDNGGAVTPDVAAKSLMEWVGTFDMSKTGQYWAPRGPG